MSTTGIWTMITAIALFVVAAVFGVMALGEFSTYAWDLFMVEAPTMAAPILALLA